MPRDVNGNYTLPGAALVTGGLVSASEHDTFRNDVATAMTDSLSRTGQGGMQANLAMGGFRVTGLGAGANLTDAAQVQQVQNSALLWGGTAGGTADARTISPSPAVAAYAAGQVFRFINGSAANTGAVTLTVSGLAATAIRKGPNAAPLVAGDLPASAVIMVLYDGTLFRLLGCEPVSNYGTPIATTTGSAHAFTGLPAGVRWVEFMLSGVSQAGVAAPLLRLGTGSGPTYATTGYDSTFAIMENSFTVQAATDTTAFALPSIGATSTLTGIIRLTNFSGNKWIADGSLRIGGASATVQLSGEIALGAALTAVQLSTSSTFDAGEVNADWGF